MLIRTPIPNEVWLTPPMATHDIRISAGCITRWMAETAEVSLIGREGIVDIFIFGPALVPTDCFIQMEGTALRIPPS